MKKEFSNKKIYIGLIGGLALILIVAILICNFQNIGLPTFVDNDLENDRLSLNQNVDLRTLVKDIPQELVSVKSDSLLDLRRI